MASQTHKTRWRCDECKHTQTLDHNPCTTRTTGIWLECEACGERKPHSRVPHSTWDAAKGRLDGSEKNAIERMARKIQQRTGCAGWRAKNSARFAVLNGKSLSWACSNARS